MYYSNNVCMPQKWLGWYAFYSFLFSGLQVIYDEDTNNAKNVDFQIICVQCELCAYLHEGIPSAVTCEELYICHCQELCT